MEVVHGNPEHRSADEPSGNMDDSLALPVADCTFTRGGPRESRECGGQGRAARMEVAAIDLLPHELLLVIFKLYIGQDTPARDLVTLSLVCKRWQNVAEGTASLWCCISGRDGLPCLRKALAMARDVPLEIKYSDYVANTDPETFWAQIGGRITQYKSFEITTSHWDHVLAVLKQANTPTLKTLYLEAPLGHLWNGSVVTLFEGEPASVALKDLHVEYIPLAIAPLRLSGLRSLELHGMPIISVEEVLRVLRESPGLEKCDLLYLTCFRDAGFALPYRVPDDPTIQLSHLRSLNLRGLPVSIIHLILSVMRVQKLREFSVDVTIEQPGQSPISDFFTTKISHLIPSLNGIVKKVGRIEVLFYRRKYWRISVGRITIGVGGGLLELSHLQETLNWVFSNLGGHLQALPVSLKVNEFRVGTDWFIWLASHLKVTKLDLQFASFVNGPFSTGRREIISLLSRPLESANNQWLLPDLESIKINVMNQDGRSKILDMVNARHSDIDEQRERRPEGIVLKPFQKIGLGGISKELGPNLEFLTELQKTGRGAEIWLDGLKWTGTECASCVSEVERSA